MSLLECHVEDVLRTYVRTCENAKTNLVYTYSVFQWIVSSVPIWNIYSFSLKDHDIDPKIGYLSRLSLNLY